MAPSLSKGEICENCLKHPSKVMHADDGGHCDNCIPKDGMLRKCKACQTVLYCSRECQRAHWKIHKGYCAVNIKMAAARKALGVDFVERQAAFEKWCTTHDEDLATAAVHALGLHRDPSRTETHVFVVYLESSDNIDTRASLNELRFVYSLHNARCIPLPEVHAMYGSWFDREGPGSFDQYLAPSPRPMLMRIFCVDTNPPPPTRLFHTLPTQTSLRLLGTARPDYHWFSHLQSVVKRGS